MTTFISSLIVIFVASLVMSLLTKEKMDKKTSSIYTFNVRAGSAIRFIAIIGMAIPLSLMVADYLQKDRTISLYIVVSILFAMGLFLLIETLPGADEIRVDHNDITVQRAWFYKKHWSFSQIEYATVNRKGIHVYVKGRKRQAFVVDNMCNGMSNFSKRLKHENIEIREKVVTQEEEKRINKKWSIISLVVVIGIEVVCALVYFLYDKS